MALDWWKIFNHKMTDSVITKFLCKSKTQPFFKSQQPLSFLMISPLLKCSEHITVKLLTEELSFTCCLLVKFPHQFLCWTSFRENERSDILYNGHVNHNSCCHNYWLLKGAWYFPLHFDGVFVYHLKSAKLSIGS